MKKIISIEELTDVLAKLYPIYCRYRKLFEEDMTWENFIKKSYWSFADPKNFYFYELNAKGGLDFFLSSQPLDKDLSLVWFIYNNPKQHKLLKQRIEQAVAYGKSVGLKKVRFITNRLTRAYAKFAKSVNAKQFLITYEKEL